MFDALVRQTTVLIAQLSTTAGIRAPLAHVADQVFVELVKCQQGAINSLLAPHPVQDETINGQLIGTACPPDSAQATAQIMEAIARC